MRFCKRKLNVLKKELFVQKKLKFSISFKKNIIKFTFFVLKTSQLSGIIVTKY